ncbi:MAG: copper-binding protein [Burkholderiales bacterium]|nr:copper-binding protein [Burkholderiales bacterium]
MMKTRRSLLIALGALPLATFAQQPPKVLVEVWKDPNCGCCKDWVAHMQDNGFAVKVNDTGNAGVRTRLGIPQNLGSCHTALVGGYAVEGHVPAADIKRLLKEKPQAAGLTVPGMPVGSPGMDGAIYKGRKDPYDVLLVQKGGGTIVYASYHQAAAVKPQTEAEVRKVDKAAGKVTLKHGDIRNLDMPGMTMVFSVKDKSLLGKVKAGDKVLVHIEKDGPDYVVTALEPRK